MMNAIVHLSTISDLFGMLQCGQIQHPLIGIVDFSQVGHHISGETKIITDFYLIMCKKTCMQHIRYGKKSFDFNEGSLICISPKQVITIEAGQDESVMQGWGLFFHPDLIRGTSLGNTIKQFSFFSYEISEALHLSEKEDGTLRDCLENIQQELTDNIDDYSQSLIVTNIELFLKHCQRFYGRQFITRKHSHSDILTAVERELRTYLDSSDMHKHGLPTVSLLADKVFLSPGYLSDLLKKEIGMNAQEFIHYHIIEEAKNILRNSNMSIAELSYTLGFEYPQYFSKLFKKKTGVSPIIYRSSN